jgi:ribonuclease HI
MPSSNVSEPLAGKEQTNQRAELTGIIRALEIAPKDRDMEILTDSSYSINCSTVWVASWIKKGWKTSTGADVMNKDLIANIKQLIEEREALGLETKFTFVKAHNGDVGNEAADKLAVAGAHAPR